MSASTPLNLDQAVPAVWPRVRQPADDASDACDASDASDANTTNTTNDANTANHDVLNSNVIIA